MRLTVRLGRKGVVVIPKAVRDQLGLVEGSVLELEVRGREVILRPLDLWDRVWGCCRGSAEEAERELDEEEARWWRERAGAGSPS